MDDSPPLSLATFEQIACELRKRHDSFIMAAANGRGEREELFIDYGGRLGGVACVGLADYAKRRISRWYFSTIIRPIQDDEKED